MGQEIKAAHFKKQHFKSFKQRLEQETQLLKHYFDEKRFKNDEFICGFELEAWLVDKQFIPASVNQSFIENMGSDMVTPELASFNVEFNYHPLPLHGMALDTIHKEMNHLWQQGVSTANSMECELIMIGILPTVQDHHLSMQNLSTMKRYQALNEQVLRLREGRPLELDIHGADILRISHNDVMLESVTTSFQIHLQVPLENARRAYNASIIVSAPLVAVSANSPFLFGKDLWSETRIPVFEQSVEVGGYEGGSHGPMRRVTFGTGYARESLFECFQENLEHYPILLPTEIDAAAESFEHLRLHNGTLWRWNRPLIGINDNGDAHLRIEHRVVPAGPSTLDAMANAAFYYGLVHHMMQADIAPESLLSFDIARDNFYTAAQHGLDATLICLDGSKKPISSVILHELIPQAVSGLQQLKISQQSIDLYMGVIENRVKNKCNGSAWQRAFVAKYGDNMQQLAGAYLRHQHSGLAVHEWTL